MPQAMIDAMMAIGMDVLIEVVMEMDRSVLQGVWGGYDQQDYQTCRDRYLCAAKREAKHLN